MPAGGTVTHLHVAVENAPGLLDDWQFFVRLNGADTEVTCTVSNTDTTCTSDPALEAVFQEGDMITIRAVGINNPPDTEMRWTARFTANP